MNNEEESAKGIGDRKGLERGLIRAIARELMKKELSVREKLALLKQQERLAKQMRESATAE